MPGQLGVGSEQVLERTAPTKLRKQCQPLVSLQGWGSTTASPVLQVSWLQWGWPRGSATAELPQPFFLFILIVLNKFILILLFGAIWVVEAVHSIPKRIH